MPGYSSNTVYRAVGAEYQPYAGYVIATPNIIADTDNSLFL